MAKRSPLLNMLRNSDFSHMFQGSMKKAAKWLRALRDAGDLNDAEYLAALGHASAQLSRATERRELYRSIQAARLPCGGMRLHTWGRDCDHYESSYTYYCPQATLAAFDADYNRMCENAEGPCSLSPVPAGADDPVDVSRDHIMEAYEDGHAWSVSL